MEGKLTYPYRSEILFLYDVFRCNPNGDPFENRPRQDPETGRIEVTDVRLKRTVRDYLRRYKGLEIWVLPSDAEVWTAEERYQKFFGSPPQAGTDKKIEEIKKNLVKTFVDVRMFGALLPIQKKEDKGPRRGRRAKGGGAGGAEADAGGGEGAGVHLTGPVQFNPGFSLHRARVVQISGTGGFASRVGARQRTLREEYIVPYALIGFYGVINENWAEDTGLTEEDVNLLMEALWYGTLSLHSRSKAFHHPRLLLRFDFKDQAQCGYFLDRVGLVKTDSGLKDEAIRSPRDYEVDLEELFGLVDGRKKYLVRILCRADRALRTKPQDLEGRLRTLVGGGGKLEFEYW